MLSPRGKICWLFAIVAGGIVGAQSGQPELTPRPGVLVLRGDRVLQGKLLRVADHYVVKVGAGSEVKVPADSVRFRCDSLHAAYEKMVAELDEHAHAQDHLQIADWCLRYGLLREAAEQLMIAESLAPDSPEAARFEKRLRLAAHRPTVPKRQAATAPLRPTVSPTALDRMIRRLPNEAVQQFTQTIQPLLLNRCAAAACHGPRHAGTFRLVRPGRNQQLTRRFTQRNLHAVLQLLDRQQPAKSLLLVHATDLHGHAKGPAINESEVSQLAELAAWVHQVVQASAPTRPVAIASHNPLLLQPTPAQRPVLSSPGQVRQLAVQPPPEDIATTAGQRNVPARRVQASVPTVAKATDPFDPAEFNRQYVRKHSPSAQKSDQ